MTNPEAHRLFRRLALEYGYSPDELHARPTIQARRVRVLIARALRHHGADMATITTVLRLKPLSVAGILGG